jgi:hypothetical protein
MRSAICFLLLFLSGLGVSRAGQTDSPPDPPTSTSYYIARTGEQFQAPHVMTYRLLEYTWQKGRWLVPDLGVIDYGHGNFQELFLGAGPVYYHSKRVMLTQMLYFAQDTGGAAGHARYIWPWPIANLQFTPRLSSETVAYVCAPVSKAARVQYDLDRSKLEYAFTPRITAGAGYSASKYASQPWQHKPFLTTTVTTRAGSFEFWLQKMPGGGQLQLRYLLVRTSH